MAHVGTCIFAEDVREEQDGRYTAVGIYAGNIKVSKQEEFELEKSVIFCVINDMTAGEHEVEYRILSPKAGTLEIGSSRFTLDEDDTNFMSIARVIGLYFPEEGDYRIEISLDGDIMTGIEFALTHDDV